MSLTREQQAALALRWLKDPVAFAKEVFPEKFTKPIPWLHRGALAILLRRTDFLTQYGELDKIVTNFLQADGTPLFKYNDKGGLDLTVARYTLLMWPRGFSKTTIINTANLHHTLYKTKRFILYISESATHAEQQLATVRRELESNPRILSVFGTLQPDRMDSQKWTDGQLETTTGVILVAKGRGSQVRGINVNAQRPDHVTFDDLEDRESTSTEEQRKKTLAWFYEELKPVLPRMDADASIVGLGTLLHPEALLMKLMNDPEWTSVRFGALDRQGEPLWAESMGLEAVEREKLSFARVGNLAGFYREYMSVVKDESTAKFKEEYFRWELKLPEFAAVAIAVDPAISKKRGSDGSAIAVAGMSTRGKIFVLEEWWQPGANPSEVVDKYFKLAKRWNTGLHGVESIAYQAALVHLLEEEQFRRGQYFKIIPITHSNKKEERVEGVLQPRYAAGYIIHHGNLPVLESQLVDWPNGKKDMPDALAMAISLLDPYAANAAADNGGDIGADKYEPLDMTQYQMI